MNLPVIAKANESSLYQRQAMIQLDMARTALLTMNFHRFEMGLGSLDDVSPSNVVIDKTIEKHVKNLMWSAERRSFWSGFPLKVRP